MPCGVRGSALFRLSPTFSCAVFFGLAGSLTARRFRAKMPRWKLKRPKRWPRTSNSGLTPHGPHDTARVAPQKTPVNIASARVHGYRGVRGSLIPIFLLILTYALGRAASRDPALRDGPFPSRGAPRWWQHQAAPDWQTSSQFPLGSRICRRSSQVSDSWLRTSYPASGAR